MLKKCPKCGCEGVWGFGFVSIKDEKRKRYKCKSCEYQFTKNSTQEYPQEIKIRAIQMLKEGVGFRGVGRLLGVSFETVRKWAKQMASRVFNVKINEEIDDVQIDEMCITIKKKELKGGFGLLILPKKNGFLTFKLEIDQQELLTNSLQGLNKNTKSNNTQPIIIQFIRN